MSLDDKYPQKKDFIEEKLDKHKEPYSKEKERLRELLRAIQGQPKDQPKEELTGWKALRPKKESGNQVQEPQPPIKKKYTPVRTKRF